MSTTIKGTYGDNIKGLRQNMGKDIEDPVIEMLSKKELDAEKAMHKTLDVPTETTDTVSDEIKYVYARIRSKGKMITYEIQDDTGFSKNTIHSVLLKLLDLGLIGCEELKARGNPKRYWVTDKPIPKEWGTVEEVMAMPAPVIETVKKTITKSAGTRAVKDPSKNALTKMMEKDIAIPQDTEDSYRRFLMDMQMLHYGVQELDDLIKDILKVVDRRLDNIAYECPLCKGKLQRNISEARCTNPRCGIKIDAGDFQKSLRVIALMKSHREEL